VKRNYIQLKTFLKLYSSCSFWGWNAPIIIMLIQELPFLLASNPLLVLKLMQKLVKKMI